MNHLVPCSGCSRHVRASEPNCPFCGEARDPGASLERVLPRGRLSRAATLAFGAVVGTSALVACSDDDDDDGGMVVPVYGAPSPTGGTSASGGTPASGGTASGGTASGGRPASGGTASGGRPASGGTASGGVNQNPGGGGGSGNTGGMPVAGTGGLLGEGGFVAIYGAPPEPPGGAGGEAGEGGAAGAGGAASSMGGNVAVPLYGAAPAPADSEEQN